MISINSEKINKSNDVFPNSFKIPLKINSGIMDKLKIKSIFMTNDFDNSALETMINELEPKNAGFTWKGEFNGSISSLIEMENKLRQTLFIGYWAEFLNGKSIQIGAATIASGLRHDCNDMMFPVIARCIIKKRFRNAGLYKIFLKSRVDFCNDLWGSKLNGIHLGTTNEKVSNIINNLYFEGQKFVRIGNEYIYGADVVDYCLFTNHYKKKVIKEFRYLSKEHDEVQKLQLLIKKGMNHGFENSMLSQALKIFEKYKNKSPKIFAIEPFFKLCKQIPVHELK